MEELMAEGRTNVYVGNIGTATTFDDIYDFLGFSNPVLRQSCAIKLISNENENSDLQAAEVAIPNSFVDNVLSKNGTLIRGRPILVAVQSHSLTKTTEVHPHSTSAVDPQPVSEKSSEAAGGDQGGSTMDALPQAEVSQQQPQSQHQQPSHSQQNPQLNRRPGNNSPPQGRPFVELDAAAGFDCYAVKSLTSAKMVHTVQRYFGEDDTKRLIAPSRRDKTVWTIETDNIHLYEDVDLLKDDRDEIIASVVVRRPRVHISSREQAPRQENRPRSRLPVEGRENEVLITLANANTNRLLFITDDEITRKLVDANFGSIVKKVQPQPAEPRSTVPGKNKYVVVEVPDKTKIPPFFEFLNDDTGNIERMYLNYRDKPRWCRLCSDTHNSECPEQAKIRQFEKERDEKRSPEGNLPVKIYTSSVGRLVNQKALCADVDAMSGGALGNILNAIGVDERSKDIKNIIVVGGGNDLNREMPPNEFATLLTGTKEKIANISPERKFALVPPPLPVSSFDSMGAAKEELFLKFLEEISENENVMVWKNPLEAYEEDFGSHPSAEQTKVLVEFLDQMSSMHFKTPLLVPSATPEVMSCRHKYGGVNPLYIFGCVSCNDRTRNKWRNLCDGCKKKANEDDTIVELTEKLISRSTEIFEAEHPLMVDLHGMEEGNSSEEGDLTCPTCTFKSANAMEFNLHFKQNHPELKPKSVREKAKFFNNDGAKK